MRWDEIAQQPCSIARALSEIGDRWTLLIIRDAMLRVRRFDDFVARSGAARNVVADRLEKLVAADILERHAYQHKPTRHEYRLTDKGRALYPVIMALVQWGDRYHDDGGGPPVVHVHESCGHTTHAVMTCSACQQPLRPRDTRVRLREDHPLHAPSGREAPRDRPRGARRK